MRATPIKLIALIPVIFAPDAAATDWVRIDAPESFYDRDGILREPSCSAGPVLTPSPIGPIPVPGETDFALFIRHGDPGKLAIAFDGGGT